MTSLAKQIKNQLLADLQKLVPDFLGAVQEIDYSKDSFSADYEAFPVAILGLSSMKSDAADNQDNIRTYTFPILILQKSENITAQTDMEDLRDAIVNVIDTDFSLKGFAPAGVLPISSPAQTASMADKTFVYFVITIEARALYHLGT